MSFLLIQIHIPWSRAISRAWSGLIPLIAESVKTAFNYYMWTVSAAWQFEEYKVDEDLSRSGLEAGYSSRVVCWLDACSPHRTPLLPRHNALIPRQDTVQQLAPNLMLALGECKPK